MKNVLIVMDSFKGCMSSSEAGSFVKKAIQDVNPSLNCKVKNFADGGEGTLDCFLAMGGEQITCDVLYPDGTKGEASYGIVQGKAIIESARAIGITLIDDTKRDVFALNTIGLGQLILDAYKRGCREFLITLGGSGTNDGGVGMLSALGIEFRNFDGEIIEPSLNGLKNLSSISVPDDFSNMMRECSFIAACDVNNPLCGVNGASFVFGPQKGLQEANITEADELLRSYGLLSEIVLNKKNMVNYEGAGAAGGLGFALVSFLNAKLISGANAVIDMTGIREDILWADMVITGEGCIDRQTLMGKGIGVLKNIACEYGKRLVAIGGTVKDMDELLNASFEVYSMDPGNMDKSLLMQKDIAFKNIKIAISKFI